MKEVTIKLYQFDELSDEAKEKAYGPLVRRDCWNTQIEHNKHLCILSDKKTWFLDDGSEWVLPV